MTTTTEQREQAVEGALGGISHISTLPEVTLKIIDLVEDPKSTAQDLHDVISGDPALCSRILKVVNSSFYGLPGQIGSINRAIVMLGLNAVKNIAIAASLSKLFRGGELTPAFSAKDLWTHSNATAATAKMLADEFKLGMGDEGYLAGLVHDIGIMVEMQFDRDRLIDVIEQLGIDESGRPTENMLELEDKAFGANHTDFGRGLAERWRFPQAFAAAAGFHHDVTAAPDEHQKLTALVSTADVLTARLGLGFSLDLPDFDVSPVSLEILGLSADQIEAFLPRIEEVVTNLDTSLT